MVLVRIGDRVGAAISGLPDVFYLAAYPVLAAAVVAAPRLAANGFQRGQQIIDAVVVISGIAMLSDTGNPGLIRGR